MSSSFWFHPTGEYSFYFNQERNLICSYEHSTTEYADGFIEMSYITIGTYFASKMDQLEWEGVYEVIIKRNKKYALLWRNAKYEPLAFASYKVISGEEFLVSDIPLTEATKVLRNLDGELLIDNLY